MTDTPAQERKAKREAKRAKQRENNNLRAAKMHKLRLSDPALPKKEKKPLKSKTKSPTQYHIGCSGWFYWHWRDRFYPSGMPTSEWFTHYAKRFKTVEINASFYSWPTAATVKSWLKQAGRRKMLYTVKVCELITHTRKFTRTQELVKDFSYIADMLGDRMGCFLYQLPPSYHYTPARLRTIVKQLQNGYRNVVEFRHASWWNEKVYEAFREARIIFCSCSAPRLPDDLIQTTPDLYIRFHGKKAWYRHNYSREELEDWADKIKALKTQHVFIYFNNDFEGYAIKNARSLARLLKE